MSTDRILPLTSPDFRACEQKPASNATAMMAMKPTMMMTSPSDSSMWPKLSGGGVAAAFAEVVLAK